MPQYDIYIDNKWSRAYLLGYYTSINRNYD